MPSMILSFPSLVWSLFVHVLLNFSIEVLLASSLVCSSHPCVTDVLNSDPPNVFDIFFLTIDYHLLLLVS